MLEEYELPLYEFRKKFSNYKLALIFHNISWSGSGFDPYSGWIRIRIQLNTWISAYGSETLQKTFERRCQVLSFLIKVTA